MKIDVLGTAFMDVVFQTPDLGLKQIMSYSQVWPESRLVAMVVI